MFARKVLATIALLAPIVSRSATVECLFVGRGGEVERGRVEVEVRPGGAGTTVELPDEGLSFPLFSSSVPEGLPEGLVRSLREAARWAYLALKDEGIDLDRAKVRISLSPSRAGAQLGAAVAAGIYLDAHKLLARKDVALAGAVSEAGELVALDPRPKRAGPEGSLRGLKAVVVPHAVFRDWFGALVEASRRTGLEVVAAKAMRDLLPLLAGAVPLPSERALPLYRKGLEALERGRPSEAVVHLERACKIAPGRADFLDALERARRRSRIQGLLSEASKAEERGDIWRALSLLKRALEVDAHDPSAISFLKRVRPKLAELARLELDSLQRAAEKGDTEGAKEAARRLSLLSSLDRSVAETVKARRLSAVEEALDEFRRLAVEEGDMEAAGRALGKASRLASGSEELQGLVTSALAEAKEALLTRSKEAQSEGDIEKALSLALRARKLLAAADPKLERWIAYLRALREAGPEGKRRALSLLKAGFVKEAEQEARAYLSVHPDDPEGWEVLAKVLGALGREGEAKEAERKAKLLETEAKVSARAPAGLEREVALVRALIKEGLVEEAVRRARELAQARPKDPRALEALCEALEAAGRKDGATEAYGRLIEARAETARREAKRPFDRLLAGLSLPSEARYERALLLALNGDFASARAVAATLLPPLREMLLAALSASSEEGLRLATKVRDEVCRLCAEAFLLYRRGDLRRALPIWLGLKGRVVGAAREAGHILAELGRLREAKDLLEEHLRAHGADPLAHVDMALLWARLGDLRRALLHASLASRLAPRSPLARATKGVIEATASGPLGAVRELKGLPKSMAVSPVVVLALSFSLERAGRHEEALAALGRLKTLTGGEVDLLEVPPLGACLSLSMRLGRPFLVLPVPEGSGF